MAAAGALPGTAARATLLANAIAYPPLAIAVGGLVPVDATPIRAQMMEVVNMAGVAKTEAAFVYEPVVRDRQIIEWRCYVPEAPLKYFPTACRFRSAAGQ